MRASTGRTRKSYRSKPSFVDESLFGETRSQKLVKAGRKATSRPDAPQNTVYLLKRRDYERIKRSAVMKSAAALRRERQESKRRKEKEMKVAFERKEEMIRAEDERKKNLPPSELDMVKMKRDETIRQRAKHLMSEQEDDVKLMNQMMQYAQTVAVRDAQRREARELKRVHELEERKLDLQMELERLQKVKMYDEREQLQKKKEREDAVVLQEQIQRRVRMRGEALSQKRVEQQKIKQRARMLEEEEENQMELKKIEAKKNLKAVLRANEQALTIKGQRKQREIEEDLQIQKYLEAKAAREQALEEEKARKAAEKEREVARMRAQQKKLADKNAALDALRARRAAEAKERQARQRELKELNDAKSRQSELMRFNRLQALAKKQVLEQAEDLDRQEFQRNYEFRKTELENFNKVKQTKHLRRIGNSKEIREQISIREGKRQNKKSEFRAAGSKVQREGMNHIEKLRSIKNKKIAELKKMGVPQKYVSELHHHDPLKALLTDYKRGGKW